MPSITYDFDAIREKHISDLIAWEKILDRKQKERRLASIKYWSMEFWTDDNGIEYESMTDPNTGRRYEQTVVYPVPFSDMDDVPGNRH